jgi:hypothetical protein
MRSARTLVLAAVGLAAAFLSLAATPPAARAADDDTYASIAFSKSTGKYGYSYNYNDPADAKARALAECDADDARVICTVGNGYAALALGDDTGAYGFGLASTPGEAKAIALRNARKYTTNCYIAVCVYSGD